MLNYLNNINTFYRRQLRSRNAYSTFLKKTIVARSDTALLGGKWKLPFKWKNLFSIADIGSLQIMLSFELLFRLILFVDRSIIDKEKEVKATWKNRNISSNAFQKKKKKYITSSIISSPSSPSFSERQGGGEFKGTVNDWQHFVPFGNTFKIMDEIK